LAAPSPFEARKPPSDDYSTAAHKMLASTVLEFTLSESIPALADENSGLGEQRMTS